MERTASRRTALTLGTGLGAAITAAALVWMAIDHATSNSVAQHVIATYSPRGPVPDLAVPWIFLYSAFAIGVLSWTLAWFAARRRAGWARGLITTSFVLGGATLVFGFTVAEYGTPILPLPWRIVCLAVAGYGAVVALIAWLPTTERITE